MRKSLNDYTDDELLNLAENSKSFYDFLTKLGIFANGGSDYKFHRKYFKNRNLNFNFLGQSKKAIIVHDENNRIRRRYTNAEMFVENCDVERSSIKKRIIQDKLIPYKCQRCNNNGVWNGEKLSLQLEHINGINNDNRLENLCFLCPNCHSQTPTFGSKNFAYKTVCKCGEKKHNKSKFCKKCNLTLRINEGKKNRIELKQLIEEIQNLGFVGVGKKYNVSDNAIRKWVKAYNIDPKNIKK